MRGTHGDVQIDETRFADIGRDELGGELNGVEEKREISSSCRAQAYLIC